MPILSRWLDWKRFPPWWREQSQVSRWSILSLAVCVVLGSALRLFNLGPSMQFQADQGRDALVAYGIFHGDLALLGPSTSVGSMYLGPLYYYFMAPFLLLAGNNPVGPAIAVAFLGIITLPVLYIFVRRLFGPGVAGWTILLYTAAPWVLEFTRFSWNPNPAPLVSLLLWWAGWKAFHGKAWWWLIVGGLFAALIQLHYVAILAILPVGLLWLWQCDQYLRARRWVALRQQVLWTLGAVLALIASFTPLVVFDILSRGIIRQGYQEYFTRSSAEQVSFWNSLPFLWRVLKDRSLFVFADFWTGKESLSHGARWVQALLLPMLLVWGLWGRRMLQSGRGSQWGYVSLILLTSILGVTWYRGVLHYHYISFLFPMIPLFFAGLISEISLWPAKGVQKVVALALAGVLLVGQMRPGIHNFMKSAGWQYSNMHSIARMIQQEIPADVTYSLALLSEIRDYRGMNYRYFLVTDGRPPIALGQEHLADYLVVIAENPDKPEEVLNSPVYEINNYPKGEYLVLVPDFGPKIYIIQNKHMEPVTQ